MASQVHLHVANIPAPEPLEKILQALSILQSGEYLRVTHRMYPKMLFPILDKRDFFYKTIEISEEHFEIYICKNSDINSKDEVLNVCK